MGVVQLRVVLTLFYSLRFEWFLVFPLFFLLSLKVHISLGPFSIKTVPLIDLFLGIYLKRTNIT